MHLLCPRYRQDRALHHPILRPPHHPRPIDNQLCRCLRPWCHHLDFHHRQCNPYNANHNLACVTVLEQSSIEHDQKPAAEVAAANADTVVVALGDVGAGVVEGMGEGVGATAATKRDARETALVRQRTVRLLGNGDDNRAGMAVNVAVVAAA